MSWRGLLKLIILLICLTQFGAVACAAELKGELLFGYGAGGWQAGLGLTQETVKTIGFFGYEKTGIVGFLSQDIVMLNRFQAVGVYKERGHVGYTSGVCCKHSAANSIDVLDNVNHVGAYGSITDVGEYGMTRAVQHIRMLTTKVD